MIDHVKMLFLPPILLTVMQFCEQEYHKQHLFRYQPFLERRGDWTYCALAIRSDHHEVKNSNLSGYNIYFFLAGSKGLKLIILNPMYLLLLLFSFFSCQTSFQRRRWQLQRQCEEQVWRKGDVVSSLVFTDLLT